MRRIAMGLALGATAFVLPARAMDEKASPAKVERAQGGGQVRAMNKSEVKLIKAPAIKAAPVNEGKIERNVQYKHQ